MKKPIKPESFIHESVDLYDPLTVFNFLQKHSSNINLINSDIYHYEYDGDTVANYSINIEKDKQIFQKEMDEYNLQLEKYNDWKKSRTGKHSEQNRLTKRQKSWQDKLISTNEELSKSRLGFSKAKNPVIKAKINLQIVKLELAKAKIEETLVNLDKKLEELDESF